MKKVLIALFAMCSITLSSQVKSEGSLVVRPEVRTELIEKPVSQVNDMVIYERKGILTATPFFGIQNVVYFNDKWSLRSDMFLSFNRIPFERARLNGLFYYKPTKLTSVLIGVSGDHIYRSYDRSVNVSVVGGVSHALYYTDRLEIDIDTTIYYDLINANHSITTGVNFRFLKR